MAQSVRDAVIDQYVTPNGPVRGVEMNDYNGPDGAGKGRKFKVCLKHQRPLHMYYAN